MTDLADQAVVLPLILAIAATLVLLGWARGAVGWIGAVGVTFGVMLVLKLVFLSCAPFGIRSPSGHTAAAALVAGGVAGLLSDRWAAVGWAAVAAALVIGATRVALHLHSVPEVALAGVLGIAGAFGLRWLAGPAPRLRLWVILAVALVVIVALHGTRLPAEAPISQWSGWLSVCPSVGPVRAGR